MYTSKMPDLPDRGSHRQTVPVEDEIDPPAYHSPEEPTSQFPASQTRIPSPSDPDQTQREQTSSESAKPDPPSLEPDYKAYAPTDPMHWELKERSGAWSKHDGEPGCLCSDTGGCLWSSRGGCLFSDREGCLCSDREGCLCSDREGCLWGDRGGCLCADLGGMLCSGRGR